jgi:hypothetical protein
MARRAKRANRNLDFTPILIDSKDVTMITLEGGDRKIPVGSIYKSNVQQGFEHDERKLNSLLREIQAVIRTEGSTTPALGPVSNKRLQRTQQPVGIEKGGAQCKARI